MSFCCNNDNFGPKYVHNINSDNNYEENRQEFYVKNPN